MSHLTIQQLVAQTDGELSGPSLKLVEKHVAECEACWHELELLAEQDALLASVVAIDPGEEFFEDLAAAVEAEISGKKKPAPRAAARSAEPRPAPAPESPAPPAEVLVVMTSAPEPEPVATGVPPERTPEPAAEPRTPEPADEPRALEPADEPPAPEPAAEPPAPEPAAEPPAPEPAAEPRALEPAVEPRTPEPSLEALAAGEPLAPIELPPAAPPPRVNPDLVETWTPPKPAPDDLFDDLALPRRVSPKPAVAAVVPHSPEPRAERSDPSPARKPAVAPSAPPAPRAPNPPVEPYGPRRRTPVASILLGVGAFILAIAAAVLVAMHVTGLVALHRSSPPPARPVVTPIEIPAPPESAPAPTPAEPPPAVEVDVPPAVIPEPAHPRLRAPRHKPAAAPRDTAGDALEAHSTTVIPVKVTHSESVVPASPQPAPAPAPAAPAAPAELGVLCGTVLDTDSHPVAGAQVMMADVGVVVLTDRTGHFCLTAPAGERTLSVVALGFKSERRLVTLGKQTPELSVTLMPAAPFPTPH